jgi:hypothetical protein
MAAIQNLVIDQGTTFVANIRYLDSDKNPINITGFDARSQMRKSYTAANAYTLTANVTSGTGGNVTVSMTAAETANVQSGRYVYDVEVYDANTDVVYRIVEGQITVYPEVTKI